MGNIKENLFGDTNFKSILTDPDFKEDSVREVIILPILKTLGYNQQSIVRSKSLKEPFLKTGSTKKPVTLIPDYCLKVENNFAWVLDAKSPKEKVTDINHIGQVYSYDYFALCNGLQFVIYRTDSDSEPILYFDIDDIEDNWDKLKGYLSPESFHFGKHFTYEATIATAKPKEFEYKSRPLLEEIETHKQGVKRHFGCNAYFTRQSWDIVQAYIKNFTKSNDLVLDPFGGSGITAIEALITGRKSIHIDLNPLSVFIASSLIAPVKLAEFSESFQRIKEQYLKDEPKEKKEIKKALSTYPYPKGFVLPKGSDVDVVEDLFTEIQLAQLAFLKFLINQEKNINIKKSLLLAFYNTISIINRTFHETPKGGGNHFGYYYRYRIAPDPANKNTMSVFENKFKRIYDGKREIQNSVTADKVKECKIIKGTASKLKEIENESIDYIYTDPPYGKKIAYLDLSTIWNAWLDLEVTEKDFKLEAIEGGEHNKTKNEYNKLISESIKEMYRVLKFDRWMSFVFAHKDPEFWHLIIETAERCGFEYVGAVPQKNGQTSFKKRQNPFTVLSGQLIINFRKVNNPKAIMKANLGMDISEIVTQTVEGIIAKNNGAKLEEINDELIIKGLELGFLDLLKKQYTDLTPILLEKFDYDEETGKYMIRKNSKFMTHVDVRLRVKYYLISYLTRMENNGSYPTFDEIIFHILPSLKNGITPEHQTILNVLEDIGEHVGENKWKLKREEQPTLFRKPMS
jgi:DNA modification methylase